MVEPPGQQGLVERLAAMERRIEELSRRGGGGSHRIARVRLDDWVPTVEFTDIPQYGYENLQLVISAGITGNTVQAIRCQFNGATTGYDVQFLQADGTAVTANRFYEVDAVEVGVCGQQLNWPTCASEAIITRYAERGAHFSTARSSFQTATGLRTWQSAGFFWGDAAEITRLTLYPGAQQWFGPQSTFTLYGLT